MSKKFGLISGIEEDTKTAKTKYQVFEAVMGFEKASVLIPVDKAEVFEQEAQASPPKSITAMKKLASKFGGLVE
jgi:hypothetical protein